MYKTQIACIIIATFIAVFNFSSPNKKTNSSKCFTRLLVVTLLQLIVNVFSIYTANHLSTVPAVINRIAHVVFMSLMICVLYLTYKYTESIIDEEVGKKIKRRNYSIIPLILTILGIIFLPLSYVESEGVNYAYGPAAFMTYIGVAIYLLLLLKMLITYNKIIPKKKSNAIYISLLSEIPIAIYQIITPESLVTCIGMTLLILGIYLTTENPDALLAEQLEKEKARADAANAAKTNFLANMSHEIRTPINTVLGMNEMIIRETTDKDIRSYALDVNGAAKSLLSIINDILDITKVEAGKLSIIKINYDTSSLFNDVSNMITFKAKAKGLDFKVEVDENIPHTLIGDDIRIRQILVNLLSNAVKYTDKGYILFKVEYLGRDAYNMAILRFTVKDTGVGIKEEYLEKIYKPFERIDETINRNIEGTGLGMSITTQLLGLLNSELKIESQYGVGSEFSFELKQPVVDSTPIGKLNSSLEEINNKYSYQHSFEAPDANILVVDDNEMNRRVFVNLLKSTKINIDQAASGQICLEKVKTKSYDIIFLDHMMPVMDGIEVFKIMKQMEDFPSKNAPVVILTANAVVGAKEMYLNEGFDEFLSKPIVYKKLEKLIKKLLTKSGVKLNAPSACNEDTDNAISTSTSSNTSSEDFSSEDFSSEDFSNKDLPLIDGLDWKYARNHFTNDSMLLDTIKFFYGTIEYDANELQMLFDNIFSDEGIKNYQIKVHSMKNSAATIGIIPLAGMAKLLENSAKDHDTETLKAVTPAFLNLWRQYKVNLSEIAGDNNTSNKPNAHENKDEINQIFNDIRNAAEVMDIDGLDKLWENLSSYDFEDNMKDFIEKIHMAIVNFDVDFLQQIESYN